MREWERERDSYFMLHSSIFYAIFKKEIMCIYINHSTNENIINTYIDKSVINLGLL